MLPFFSKILEKIFTSHLNDYLDKQNSLSRQQFGFRKGLSTQTAVSTFTGLIRKSIDSGYLVAGLFINLAKDFDFRNHFILKDELLPYRINGIPLTLICSYLKDWQQIVQLGDFQSNSTLINLDIPQGSILGPLFYFFTPYK